MTESGELWSEPRSIVDGMWLLPNFADSVSACHAIDGICASAPLRHMTTTRGFSLSVAMTNCGKVGWVSDRRGYRYSSTDPDSGNPWPSIPDVLADLATRAAAIVGFHGFIPDACLVNRYLPGNQMGAHQDKDEQDFSAPIVSVSLGIPARFLVNGEQRNGKSIAVDVQDGDVIVFGGPARRHFHGVRKLKSADHPRCGAVRWNLTFRKAL